MSDTAEDDDTALKLSLSPQSDDIPADTEEHGHVIARGKNKGKRVPPKPHIYMNRDKYMEQFYEKCVKIVAEGVRLNKEK